MKRIIYILLLFTLSVTAQNFSLTPEGFKCDDKNYLILNIENKSKSELYKEVLIYFNSYYKSPKDVISTVEGEMITINGYAPKSIRKKSLNPFNMDYTISIHFKENKIKIDAPTFILKNLTQTLHLKWTKFSMNNYDMGIYGKGDKLKNKKAKADLDIFFTHYINNLKEALTSKDVDW